MRSLLVSALLLSACETVILGPHEASRPYYGVAEQYCPNHIPEHVSLTRHGIMRVPTTVYYCPLCEKEMLERLRTLSMDEIAKRYETFKLMSQFEVSV